MFEWLVITALLILVILLITSLTLLHRYHMAKRTHLKRKFVTYLSVLDPDEDYEKKL